MYYHHDCVCANYTSFSTQNDVTTVDIASIHSQEVHELLTQHMPKVRPHPSFCATLINALLIHTMYLLPIATDGTTASTRASSFIQDCEISGIMAAVLLMYTCIIVD